MITNIEEYFSKGCGRCERFATADCSTRQWSIGLAELRRICLGLGLVETAKWGHPCYMHGNRNVVILGALRNDFILTGAKYRLDRGSDAPRAAESKSMTEVLVEA